MNLLPSSTRLSSAKSSWLPALATLGYAALVAVLAAIAFGALSEIAEKRAAVAEASDLLDRLQGRRPMVPGTGGGPVNLWTGSPLLEGSTVTVAGAGLLQRVSSAVARFDGRITSSRVELLSTPFGPGFLSVSASLEIAQPDLQKLLYDLEAGLPFLFVDELVVQGHGASAEAADGREAGRMQVTLTVYGQWQGAR